jgi:protein O-GlcNAc transferase
MSSAPRDEGYHKAHALYKEGKREQAESHLRRFLQRQPRHAPANNLMAILLLNQGRIDRAAYHAQIAADEEPQQVIYLNTLGVVLTHARRPTEAAETLRRAMQVQPGYSGGWNSLGIALSDSGDVVGAEEAFATACRLAPADPQPRINRAKLYLDTGRADQAVSELRTALQLAPGHPQALSDLAGALNYTRTDPGQVLDVHCRLGQVLERQAGVPAAAKKPAVPRPRLRVGYVSGDFRAHSVSFFIEPLLRAHDRRRFEIFCYHASPVSDDITRRLKPLAQHWRDVGSLDSERLASRIAQDQLDVLIDLSGHTSGNRLAALARRPAPVQATWCGYANTTGMHTIDFRIVDAWTDPPGAEALATERLIRLERCFLCYQPPADAPPPAAAPTGEEAGAAITFGSFNMLPKISPAAISLWSRALATVPDSRIIIKAKGMKLPGVSERILAEFAAAGIGADRVELIDFVPGLKEHLALYNRVDIALDTFPYQGTTTTCEALWMGVPVISRIGDVHASRVGLSLLAAVGLPQLAAGDDASFASAAAALAGDRAALSELRASLRRRMAASPLCDAADFARHFEAALESMASA